MLKEISESSRLLHSVGLATTGRHDYAHKAQCHMPICDANSTCETTAHYVIDICIEDLSYTVRSERRNVSIVCHVYLSGFNVKKFIYLANRLFEKSSLENEFEPVNIRFRCLFRDSNLTYSACS